MLYRFRIVDPEQEGFLREYEVSPCHTFFDLHSRLSVDLSLCNESFASFFVASEQWDRGMELTLFDMANDTELAAIPMDSLTIGELAREEGARFVYTYDGLQDRSLFLQLVCIEKSAREPKEPICVRSVGTSPGSGSSFLEVANRDIAELLRGDYDGYVDPDFDDEDFDD